MDQIQEQIFLVLQNVLLALITVLGGMAVRYIQQHFTAKQMNNAKGIAQIAASSVQEIGKSLGLNGPEKLAAAISQAQNLGSKAGIKLTSEQWNALIHDALAALKDIWNTAVGLEPFTSSTKNAPTINIVPVATQMAYTPTEQIPGRWVIGKDFICNFPNPEQKDKYQFFAQGNTGYEELKLKVESYAEKVEQSMIQFYVSLHV